MSENPVSADVKQQVLNLYMASIYLLSKSKSNKDKALRDECIKFLEIVANELKESE